MRRGRRRPSQTPTATHGRIDSIKIARFDAGMTSRLLVAGSNSGYQLGVGHNEDVRELHEALCRPYPASDETIPFPPPFSKLFAVSSGANHTLTLVAPTENRRVDGIVVEIELPKQIWIAGTGTQGQLGPSHVSSEPARVFTRLDLSACLDSVGLTTSEYEPEQVVCGWNCSYIVLVPRNRGKQDVLISLGFHRDNTFGELGCRMSVDNAGHKAAPSVHLISFSSALREAGLDASALFRIIDVAAGLRHAVTLLSITSTKPRSNVLVAGWGSARHGQIGSIPEPAATPAESTRRPGPTPTVVYEPQLIFNWRIPDLHTVQPRVQAGRDFSIVLMRGQIGAEGTGLHMLGSKKRNQQFSPFAATMLEMAPAHPDDVVVVGCNWNSMLFLMSEGNSRAGQRIVCSGSNAKGQLGDGDRASFSSYDRLTQVDLGPLLQRQISGLSSESSHRLKIKSLVSGSEHSLILVSRHSPAAGAGQQVGFEVWGWGWNEHGNLAQGPHDEADRDRPVLLLDGTRTGAATSRQYWPLNIWAGCGTSFILAHKSGG